MKKLTTKIIKNNKLKSISVLVEDQVAEMIENVNEKFRHEYIVSEYESSLLERKETRRHQSLELSLDNGHEFINEEASIEDIYIDNDRNKNLYKAISFLSEDQQWLVKEVYFKGRSQVEIANELKVDKSAIRHRIERILQKLKKFLD